MMRALPLTLALLLTAGAVHAQSGLGRLFNSPQERQALDRQRGKAVGIAASPAASPAAATAQVAVMGQTAAAGQIAVPGQGAQAGVQYTVPNVPAGMAGEAPPNTPPGMPPSLPPATPPGLPDAGNTDAPAAAAAAPSQLTMNGVLRLSNGRSTVWLNNVPQGGSANKFSNRNRQALTVTLPSGKRVLLQPGQRYDLADGRVKDISEP
jgi:hypothetical protein